MELWYLLKPGNTALGVAYSPAKTVTVASSTSTTITFTGEPGGGAATPNASTDILTLTKGGLTYYFPLASYNSTSHVATMVYPMIVYNTGAAVSTDYWVGATSVSFLNATGADSWSSAPTEVQNFKIEYQNIAKNISIDNGIIQFANMGSIGVPLGKVYFEWAFNRVWIGPTSGYYPSYDPTVLAAQRRERFIAYAVVAWPKLAGKVSPIYVLDPQVGLECTQYYPYKMSTYTRVTTLIQIAKESLDHLSNGYLDQLGVMGVWS